MATTPPSSSISEAELNTSRSSEIIAGSVVLIVVPTTFVILRLLSRWMARASLWWDDYTAILACVFSWGDNIIELIGTREGYGKHIETLPINVWTIFFKYLFAFQLLYEPAIILVKLSIIATQYRMFRIIHYRRILIGCTVFVVCLFISQFLAVLFSCIPVSNYWETFTLGPRCIDVVGAIRINGGINAATDFILLAMPIPILWKLRTGTQQKWILTFIFTTGLVVCAVSIVRLCQLEKFNQADITWSFVRPALWTAAEPSIGVVSACLPSLRPLFTKLLWGRSYRPEMLSGSRNGSSRRFERLDDSFNGNKWTNNVVIKRDDDEEYEFGERERRSVVPENGIRVRTTVTVIEGVDWQDDLF